VGGDAGPGTDAARRLFISEARRRVLSLLADLRAAVDTWGEWPPPWTWVRVAALGEQLADEPATSSAAIDEAISSVEGEIRAALSELLCSLADRPIPFRVLEPLPPARPLRPYLALVRGERV
jgi:hypothetical protein